jgi:hypothetical protein
VSSNHDSGRTTDRVQQRATDVDDDGSSARRQAEVDGRSHAVAPDRHSVVSREKDRFGGIKWGSAFFGWLTATGTGVILTALVAGAGTAVGVATDTTATDATDATDADTSTVGIIGGIAILAILLLAYYCGGYVAGRMARFNGIKQGVAVWVWSLAIAVVVAVSSAVLGNEFDVLGRLNGFPRIPVDEGDLTTGGIIALAVAVIAALLGAVAGGLAGMRFHRKVDKAGLGR